MKKTPNRLLPSSVSSLAVVVLSAAEILTSPSAQANTYDWSGATSGNIGTAAAWGGTTPTGTDVARWNAAIYTNPPTVNANITFGELLFDAGNTAGVIFGSGTSTLTLNGISGVGIQLNNGSGAVNTGSAKFALGAAQAWTNDSASLLTVGGTIANGGFNLTLDGSGNTTLGGIISGTGGIVKSGAGNLTLSGANTFTTGGVSLSAGTLTLGNNAALGATATSVLTIAGGTVDVTAARTTSNAQNWNADFTFAGTNTWSTGTGAVTLNANRQVTVSASSMTVGGVISDGGSGYRLTKAGAGTLVLSGANTLTGGINLTAGTLSLGNDAALGGAAGALTITGGTIDVTAARATTNNNAQNWNGDFTFAGTSTWNTGTGAVTLNANRQVTVSASTMTVGGAIGDGGNAYGLTKAGAGTLVLAGANTYTGATTISDGTLSAGTTANLGGAASNLVFDGGTLQITGTTLTNVSSIGHTVITNSGKTVGLDINASGNTFTYDQLLNQGTGGLTKLGTGTLVLNQANTYSGTTSINTGTLQISASSNLGNGSVTNVITMAGGKLQSTGGSYDLGKNRSISLSASSSIQIDGGGLTVSGDITSTANSTLLFLTAPVAASSVLISGTVTDGVGGKVTALSFGTFSSGSGVGSAEITGTNSYSGQTLVNFLQGGIGTLTTSGTNSSLTGTTMVQGGTLNLNNASNGGLAGGQLTLFVGNLKASVAATLSNAILNSNNFGITGSESITFNGDLTAGAASGRGFTNSMTAGTLTLGGSKLNLGTSIATTNIFSLTGSGNTVVTSLIQDYSGGVGTTGAGLTMGASGTGLVTLTNNANSYTGSTAVTGKVAATAGHAFGDTTGISLTGAGNLSLRGDSSTNFSKLTGGALYSLSTSASGATFNADQATVAGTGAKTMAIGTLGTTSTAAAYTVNFTGANNTSLSVGAVTGAASTAAGTVTLANAIAGGGALTLGSYTSANTAGGENLTFSGVGDTAVSGAITPSGTLLKLTKSGAGTLALSGSNTYTGTTTVSTGKLLINGDSSAATGNVSVAAAATLGGVGTIGGATTISGIHAPGNSTGLQTFSTDLNYAASSIFEWELAADKDTDSLGVRGVDYDAVNITGNLVADSNAIFRVVLAGANLNNTFWDTNQSWTDIFSKGFTTGGFTTAALQVYQGGSSFNTSAQGSFTITGGTLNWTAVPEPSSALIGGLLVLATLRRRRCA